MRDCRKIDPGAPRASRGPPGPSLGPPGDRNFQKISGLRKHGGFDYFFLMTFRFFVQM